MSDQLRFGLNPPVGVETAWGARWIIDPEGRVDEVCDRTDVIGPEDRRRELLAYLNDHVGRAPHQAAGELLRSGALRWSDETTVTLYDDEVVTVVGNPRRSFGYLYVGAWFKADIEQTPPCETAAPRRRVRE
jgi:hypothetical protein